MKRLLLSIAFLAAIAAFAPSAHTAAAQEVAFRYGYFYRPLAAHGEWIEVDPGVYVWHPRFVRHGWRPYMVGRWAWTDYGWYWVSSEPFGWITYHYGRWYYDDFYGWVWVPDDTWGPAWVDWRYDDSYIGWAPLPPMATFNVSFGIRFTHAWAAPVGYWNFVTIRTFGGEIRTRDYVPERTVRRLIGATRIERTYTTDGGRIINRGVDRTFIERGGNRRIDRVDVTNRNDAQGERTIRGSGTRRIERIEVYRPQEQELRTPAGQVETRRGERSIPTLRGDNLNRTQPSGATNDPQPANTQAPGRNRPRSESPAATDQPQRNNPPAVQPQDRPRNRDQSQVTPNQPTQREKPQRVNRDQEKRERKEMRKELIQRYDKRNPGPSSKRVESAPSRPAERRSVAPKVKEERRGEERRREK